MHMIWNHLRASAIDDVNGAGGLVPFIMMDLERSSLLNGTGSFEFEGGAQVSLTDGCAIPYNVPWWA